MFVHYLRNFKNPGYLYLLVLTFILRIVPIIKLSTAQEVIVFEPYIKSILPISLGFLSTPWLNLSLAGILIFFQAIIFNQILIQYNIFPKPSYIPAAVFILLCSLFPNFLTLQPVIIVNFFMIWLIERLFSIYKTDQPITRAFDLGLIIACGTFVYFPFIILLPIIWIGLSIFLPYSWRSWLSGLLGFLVMYLFVGTYFFWSGHMDRFLHIFSPLDFKNPTYLPIYGQEFIPLIPLIIALFLSIYYYQANSSKSLILVRKSLNILIYLTILSGIGYYLQPVNMQNLGFRFSLKTHHPLLHFFIWSSPLSVYLSYYFIFARKRWIYELVFLSLLGSIIFIQAIFNFNH